MRIDLHTHSRASDGTQTPTELVEAAVAAGLDVLALTDHDTAAGWAEATVAAQQVGLTLVPGMEISTKLDRRDVHLLAYLPDPTYAPLQAALAEVLEARTSRVPAIVAKLVEHGVDITVEDVVVGAGGPAAFGRPHVADALVAKGVVGHRNDAFADWLSPGRPAHVPRQSVGLERMLALVAESGGVTVIAHPWGRYGSRGLEADTIAALVPLGLSGLEVDHQDHDADVRRELRGIAEDLDLVITGSSDHHGIGKTNHDLGCNTTDPAQFHRLLDLAARASVASGRSTPEVVGPVDLGHAARGGGM